MAIKILMVTTFPFPIKGAGHSDCANGIFQLRKLGFDIKIIMKLTEYQPVEEVQRVSKAIGVEMIPVSYKFDTKFSKIQKFRHYLIRFLTNPLILDGAAFEYNDPELKEIFETKIKNWQPDFTWFDFTYTWPLYKIARKYKKPIIVRSLNFESVHFLQEKGYNFVNYLRFLPKFFGEILVIKKSDLIFAITPREANTYRKFGAKNVEVLPLRGLPACLKTNREIKEREKLSVFFMGSSYNIFHMRVALEFILKEIVPRINKIAPNKFFFHIFGGKFPNEYNSYLESNVIYRGYVENLEDVLEDMDIALIPSICGAGMQQKIFEPLSRGIPTITSHRGIVGYPFENGKSVLLASNADEFIEQLIRLRDLNLRKSLSKESLKICNQLFSQERLDSIVISKINNLLTKINV